MKTKSIWRFLPPITLIAVLIALATQAADMPPAIQWQKSFGGTNNDGLAAIQPTDDGGYILVGDSTSGISGNKTSPNYGGDDGWVLRIDGDGNKVWEKSFGGEGDDSFSSVLTTSDGGFFVAGTSRSGVSGNKTSANYGGFDYWVLKLDADGNKIWENTFGGSEDDFSSSAQLMPDGGYLIGGTSYSGVSGNKTSELFGTNAFYRPADYWLVRLDADGNKLWERSYGGYADEHLTSLQKTSDGGYILGGDSNSDVSGNKTSTNYFGSRDYWIVKLDASANIVWDKSFGGYSEDLLGLVRQTDNGGYVVGGSSFSFPAGNKTSPYFYDPFHGGPDYWAIKLDANGNIVWDRSFGGIDFDYFSSVLPISGGYLLGGTSSSDISGNKANASLGSSDYWLVKVTENGDKVWEASFGGADGDGLAVLQQTSNGYILGGISGSAISGNKTSTNYGGSDIWIVKLEGPPRITSQPQSRNVAVGDSVTFGATVVGVSPLNYQWLFNGTNITGATGPTLTLTNTIHAQAGFYSLVVSNEFGTVTSTRAQLMFNFLTLQLYAGLTIDGEVGQTYRIEYLSLLGEQNDWQSLATVTLTNTPYLFIDRQAPISAQRFYRAVLSP